MDVKNCGRCSATTPASACYGSGRTGQVLPQHDPSAHSTAGARPGHSFAGTRGGDAPQHRRIVRLDVRVAVHLDLDAIDPSLLRAAEELISADRVGELSAVGGGAIAAVDDLEAWAGVVDGAFVGECDCGAEGEDLCVHAAAVTVVAVRDGFAWSSAATPPSQAEVDPRVRELTALAATLPVRRLAAMLGEYAAGDRRLEARLLVAAGQLGAPTEAELATVRRSLSRIASKATSARWSLADVLRAGEHIRTEVEVLAERPATEGALAVVEHAARLWDEVSVHLYDDTHLDRDPGEALRAAHVSLCERLDVDPDELIDRLVEIIGAAEVESCLDEPDDYLAVIGPEGVKALLARR